MVTSDRDGRGAFVLATLGVAAGVAVTIYLLTSPVYSNGATLLEVNPEPGAVAAVLVPSVFSIVIWVALATTCRTGSRLARGIGTSVAWLLFVFSILAGFTVGAFAWPGALLLMAAASMTPDPAR